MLASAWKLKSNGCSANSNKEHFCSISFKRCYLWTTALDARYNLIVSIPIELSSLAGVINTIHPNPISTDDVRRFMAKLQ